MTQKPRITPLTVRGKLADPLLWHESGQEVCLGCSQCPELALCGGLSVQAPVFNCMDLCCGTPKTCRRYVCPNQRRYSTLVNEVDGLELRPYRHRVAPMLALPEFVPCILDTGDLAGPLSIPVVALSLYSIIDLRTGLARFSSRQEMLQRFKVDPDARVILTATGNDRRVENFWHALRPKKTVESIRRLRPALIATPNFSMHADAVRHDNLLSMARIAACFEEFAVAKLPVAVHVNGRTPHDFQRWIEYLKASQEIYAVSYEMGTMGRSAARRAWHAQQLIRLAHEVNRPLTLLMRGGSEHLIALSMAFHRVVWTDTTAHMKAKMRQTGTSSHGKVVWTSSPTAAGEPIDELLLHNIRVYQRAMRFHLPKRMPTAREPATSRLYLDESLVQHGN